MSKKGNLYELTDKQIKFCHEYLIDFNGTQAAVRAGYSKKTANEIASENLAKLNIQQYLNDLKSKTAEKLEVTAEQLTAEWKKIAFSSVSHLHNSWIELKDFDRLTDEQKDCIESIDTKVVKAIDDEGKKLAIEWVKIKLYSKTKALEELGKRVGYYEADNRQKKLEINIPTIIFKKS